MIFRDPKTREVFRGDGVRFCGDGEDCEKCPIKTCFTEDEDCAEWVNTHPAEAARRMGYEVVEDKPAADSEKPFFCAHIGVSPGQPFIVHGYPYHNYAPMVYGEDGCVRLYAPDGQKRHKVGGRAITWMVDHPECVEPCVGYTLQEVAFKKEERMEKKDKLRICEVLGVEVGESFTLDGLEYWITSNGLITDRENTVHFSGLTSGINHPDRIIRKHRFTEEEVADAKNIMRFLQTAYSIERYRDNTLGVRSREQFLTNITNSLFPSLRPGRAVRLEDITKGPT